MWRLTFDSLSHANSGLEGFVSGYFGNEFNDAESRSGEIGRNAGAINSMRIGRATAGRICSTVTLRIPTSEVNMSPG
jgi:hypothetical protein